MGRITVGSGRTSEDEAITTKALVRRSVAKHLSFASSETPKKKRWTEVTIERHPHGYYIVTEKGRSRVRGEKIRKRVTNVTTPQELYTALTFGTDGKLSKTAYTALLEAAKVDSAFAAIAAPVMPADLEERRTDRAFGREIVLPVADGERPVRFIGREIGGGSSSGRGRAQWMNVVLYRTNEGNLVGVVDRRGLEDDELVRKIVVATQGAELVRKVTPPGSSHVYQAVLDALAQARNNDATLDDEIGHEDTLDWAANCLGPASVRHGDYRYRVLEYLERTGAHIMAREGADANDGTTTVAVAFVGGTEEAPLLSEGIFMRLSRQRFIRRDREAEAALGSLNGVSVWRISNGGKAALKQAQAREDDERLVAKT
jgi:hypothetical protein